MATEIGKEIIDFVGLIDANFEEYKAQRLSRMSVAWGKWSRRMNLVIRSRIEQQHPQATLYKYLFMYWINRSQLLEEHYKSKWRQGKKRRLAKEGRNLRRIILSGDAPDIEMETDSSLAELVLRHSKIKRR